MVTDRRPWNSQRVMLQVPQGSVRQEMESQRAVDASQRLFNRVARAAFIVGTPVVVYLSVRFALGDGVDSAFHALADALGT